MDAQAPAVVGAISVGSADQPEQHRGKISGDDKPILFM
jgi:hypothetical protein